MDIVLRFSIFCLLCVFYFLYGVWFVVLIFRGCDDKNG